MNILLVLRNQEKEYVFSMYCYGSNSFLFVNVTKIYKFKVKDSEIMVINSFQLHTINSLIHYCFNLNIVVNFFSVDYNAIDTSLNLDIHRY